MPDITLITPPDKLYNDQPSVLLVNPSDVVKNDLNEALKDTDLNINLYLYENGPLGWLIDVAQSVDHIILDIDAMRDQWIIGYLLNLSKTFYLTNQADSVYNIINVNRIYDINQFIEGVNNFETKQLEQ
jgi:hypothetical protein